MMKFIKGMFFYWAIQSLYQDLFYGSAEAFCTYVMNGGWIDKSITIPLAIFIIILCIIPTRYNQ